MALYSDAENENAAHCFQMFSLHTWYFHLHDTFTVPPHTNSFYQDLLKKLSAELLHVTGSTNFFQGMTLDQEAKTLETLSLE